MAPAMLAHPGARPEPDWRSRRGEAYPRAATRTSSRVALGRTFLLRRERRRSPSLDPRLRAAKARPRPLGILYPGLRRPTAAELGAGGDSDRRSLRPHPDLAGRLVPGRRARARR